MNVERRPYSPPRVVTRSSAISIEKRARIRDLYEEGLSVVIISERLGLHRNTIHLWLRRLELLPPSSCSRCGCRRRGCRGHSFEATP